MTNYVYMNSISKRESLYLCPIANAAKQYNFTEVVVRGQRQMAVPLS